MLYLRVAPVAFVLVAALVGLAFAGCLGQADPPAGGVQASDDDPVGMPGTWHFDDAWGLTEGSPVGETRAQPLGDFYSRWAVGSGFPQWSSAPLTEAILVQGDVVMDFWLTAESVVTSTPGIFPDFVVYFGTTESLHSVVSPTNLKPVAADFSVITSADVVQVHVEFALPPGGVTVPSGVGLRVVTAPVMMETDQADLEILYGSEEFPSAVAFTYHALKDDPSALVVTHEEVTPHTLAAGTFLHGQEVEGTNVYTETIEITNATRGLLVDLDFTGSTPFPDMDLYVFAPNGTQVALSVTPGADESVHLYRANLDVVGPGTWSIKVINYVTAQATFTLGVRLLEAAS